jgi:peroxiredoxin
LGVMSNSQSPPPPDDGAYDHVLGATLPSLLLPSTTGGSLDVCNPLAVFTVLFLYPMTGTPGQALPEGWTEIPGAVGCTPQSCAYRDLVAEFEALDASVRGISTQTPEDQAEFATREHIPYPLLSDSDLQLATAMALPTFVAGEKARLKRASLIVQNRSVLRVLYPVLDPAANAGHTLTAVRELLASSGASSADA